MITLLFVACALSLTIVTDFLGFAGSGIPEGYEDDRGFHFGPMPLSSRN